MKSYLITTHDTYRRLDERVPVDGPWQQGAVTSLMDHVSKVHPHIMSYHSHPSRHLLIFFFFSSFLFVSFSITFFIFCSNLRF